MANVKISSLEETQINNPDESFVMVVAKGDASSLYKNYRISLTELRNIIGSIEGDIVAGVTEKEVIDIVNSAISTDNIDELTAETVGEMIKQAIANIPTPEPGLSESKIQGMINASISADNSKELTVSQVTQLIKDKIDAIPEVTPGLSESQIQDMIDASITADNLKPHIETTIPVVIPETTIEVTSDSLETPTSVKVIEVAEKAIINEIEITKIKETTEDCVCGDDADDCFNEIFKYIENI